MTVKQSQWTVATVLKALQNVAAHPDVKPILYFDVKLAKYLREIIYYGNEYEKESAIYLLWEMCFDKLVADDVIKDKQLVEYLNKLANESSKSTDLKTVSNGVLFQVKLATGKLEILMEDKMPETVRLVWEKKSEELSTRVATELERLDFRVCSEVRETVVSFACLVVFLTGKLKYTPECRSQIEYAIAMKTPIFAVIAESGYKSDGW